MCVRLFFEKKVGFAFDIVIFHDNCPREQM